MRVLLKVTQVVVITLALVVAVDQYLHRKYDYWLFNYRGYRGDVVGEKRPGEHRVGVFGGSVAMGYGVTDDLSIAGHLQRLLDDTNAPKSTVVNLTATGDQGLAVLAENYETFEYLRLDTVVFLLFSDAVACRVDATSVRDWRSFIDSLTRHHKALASQVMDVAGVRSPADALNAVGDQRKRIIEAFSEALNRPDAVDPDRLADVQRSYGVSENAGLACLTNLLLLQPTLGHAIEPIDGVEQMRPSRRMGNLAFRYFGYWFIVEERAWEEYFALRYGDISEGYRTDPLLRWVARVRSQVRQLGGTGEMPREADTRPYTSTDLFGDVIGQPGYLTGQTEMKEVCLKCHASPNVDRFYADAETVVSSTNDRVQEGQALMAGLRSEGLLTPEPFDETIEFLYFDFWHYFGRTAKHGAFMGGADFVQWHGNYELLLKLTELKEMADGLRSSGAG